MLLDEEEEGRRRSELASTPVLRALAERLNRHLDPLRDDGIFFPTDKAALTRRGGVCPEDGARLQFRPLHPWEHLCPRCGQTVRGDLHHRAWVWRYHLWLTERAVHAAALYRLGIAEDGRDLAWRILDRYLESYRDFPNRDNVLGPTRLFFSTYLESIWLLQITTAANLLAADDPPSNRDDLEDTVAESAELIQSFDEGFSNRQVWNNAALIGAGLLLDDDTLVARAAGGPHGLVAALNRAVSPNGRWAEGENYHFFALRGFQLAAELLRGAGYDLYADAHTARLAPMYSAPFLTLLPDLTFPARGDSPYGVSVCQPRFAELWEVARARLGGEFDAVLAAMYRMERGPDVGLEEIAEVEFHRPGAGVRRDGLGWRALLWMRTDAPEDTGEVPLPSGVVAPRGPAVLRPAPGQYVALETGTGAGHGHPDALHLTLFDRGAVLSDPGTGSYVTPSLHWYRSTLAHNAPGVAGVGQLPGLGWCSAFDEQERFGWAQATGEGVVGETSVVQRAVVVSPDFTVDVVDVRGPEGATVDLPLHLRGDWSLPDESVDPPQPEDRARADGLETGYDVLEVLGRIQPAVDRIDGGTEEIWSMHLPRRAGETLLLARAPGPPSLAFADGAVASCLVRRARGPGRWVSVYSPGRRVTGVRVDDDAVVVGTEAGTCTISITGQGAGATVTTEDGHTVSLAGRRVSPPAPRAAPSTVPHVWCPMLARAPRLDQCFETLPWNAIHPLREMHYRRAEDPYPGVDRFSARFGFWVTGERLYVAVEVRKPELIWWDATVDPELDNENPAIHADGVQVYWAMPDADGARAPWRGCLVLPQPGGGVRCEPVRGLGDGPEVEANWMVTSNGYRVMASCRHDRPLRRGDQLRVNVVVNEMRPGRIRRAGQLVFQGGGGWTYLRGDREPMHTAAVAEVR